MAVRTPCIYHHSEFITNFCRNKNCLMPLCPVCISEHTRYHQGQHTRPQYDSISGSLADTHAQIDGFLECLGRDRQRNQNLIVTFGILPQKVKQKIQAVRESVLQAVSEAFICLQREVFKKLEKLHEQKDVYSTLKAQKYDKALIQHTHELTNLKEGLRTDRALSNMIYFFREKQLQVFNFHNQLSASLHINERYSPSIELNHEAINSIQAIISRAVKVTAVYKNMANELPKQLLRHCLVDRAAPNHLSNSRFPNTSSPLKTRKIHSPDHTPFQPFSNPKQTGLSISPHGSRLNKSGGRSSIKYEGNYEELTKRVAELREQNQLLSKYLR